jgi:hypothetical protein
MWKGAINKDLYSMNEKYVDLILDYAVHTNSTEVQIIRMFRHRMKERGIELIERD